MWNPKIIDTDKVLYIAIADAIERDIDLDILKPNEKMPSQRNLAKIIGVNLTTISRAYTEAKKRKLITGNIGKGTYVLKKHKNNFHVSELFKDGDDTIEMGLVGSIDIPQYEASNLFGNILKNNRLNSILNYDHSQGILRHREIAVKWIDEHGIKSSPENIVICSGATHAINCSLLGLFEPGDKVAVDSLTFTGFKNAAKLANINIEPVLMDLEGMVPENLESLCKKHEIKGIYLMPNMQNPTSTIMSPKRKQDIANIILKYNLILIEDDIYNFTNFDGRTALSSLVPNNGIFISGISKAFFPGLRIAFTHVPEKYLYKFIQAVTTTVWMASTIGSEIVVDLIERGLAKEIIAVKKDIISRRLQIAKNILKDFSFQISEGSMFLWLTLPKGWSCAEFENIALLNKVRIISSYKFYVGNGTPPNAVRVSLGAVKNEDELIKGLNILANILKQNPISISPIM